jgi:hypothetical protein
VQSIPRRHAGTDRKASEESDGGDLQDHPGVAEEGGDHCPPLGTAPGAAGFAGTTVTVVVVVVPDGWHWMSNCACAPMPAMPPMLPE